MPPVTLPFTKAVVDVVNNLNQQVAGLNSIKVKLSQQEGTQQGDILISRLNDQVNKIVMVLDEINLFLGT